MATVNAADIATIQAHVSTLQTTKSALNDTLAALAPTFEEGEQRVLNGPAVQVLVKQNGEMTIKTIKSATDA